MYRCWLYALQPPYYRTLLSPKFSDKLASFHTEANEAPPSYSLAYPGFPHSTASKLLSLELPTELHIFHKSILHNPREQS